MAHASGSCPARQIATLLLVDQRVTSVTPYRKSRRHKPDAQVCVLFVYLCTKVTLYTVHESYLISYVAICHNSN